ncbi:amino acid transporter AVT1D-like [Lotus japonicus]|uniref:amino acid transporter AVT1D-like n=1 Tax=Lotus japonicus TaxID=34305 RepID=UPI002585F7CE|nr:amino acid transporter AVT1D-like [Lotus japonicus]
MLRGEIMKLDEDLGPDREDDFQTDDEENQGQRVFENLDDQTDSDNSQAPSRNLSNEVPLSPSWPQSYRQSMDMLTNVSVTPPGLGLTFLRRMSSTGRSNSASQQYQDDSSLTTPLVSDNVSSKQPHHVQSLVSSSCTKFSASELPPPQQQCSFAQSVINGTNILCGIGILTIPYAVKEGGWLSLTILVMFAIMCCYTGILLMKCLDSDSGLKAYPDIGQAAFGIFGRLGISIVLYMELFASCVEYITLFSDNLESMFPNTNIRFAGTNLGTHQIYAITAALLVLPTVWLRNLSLLSYISVGGIFASILVTFCLFWVGVIDQAGVQFKPGGKLLDLANISVSIGVFGFGFAGHAVFPNIYSSMKEPSKFPSVIYISFAFCLVMYISVAAVGYLTFGDSIESQFTLNMPKELYASKIAIWTTVVTPIAKYAITLLPISLSIEELVPSPRLKCYAMSVLIRTVLVILSLVVALSVPYFGSVLALVGSLMSMLVALIYPCACYLKLHKGSLSKIEITNCYIIICVGLICASMGTYSAMTRIFGEGD